MKSMKSKEFVIYVIYDHPSDYPNEFVMKRDVIAAGRTARDSDFIMRAANVEELRRYVIERGLIKLMPDPADDPVILETWI